MEPSRRYSRLLLPVGLAAGVLVALSVAGPLDPPGGPIASTHKTLTEIEPRIAVNPANTPGDAIATFKITKPGSYYLTANLIGEAGKYGILISASNVELDLSGFALLGVPGSMSGILTSPGGYASDSVVVKNGTVSDWGLSGINIDGYNAQVTDITASYNGNYGISAGGGGTIKNCTAFRNAWSGIYAYFGGVIDGCNSMQNAGSGIWVHSDILVTNCNSTENQGDGITLEGRADVIRGSNSNLNAGAGIRIAGTGSPDGANRIDENNVANNAIGISAGIGGNIIVRNSLRLNTTQWSMAPGNDVGPIGSAATATSPWANFQY